MKSTIDMAKEAGVDENRMHRVWVFTESDLETFRALCVAEEHKRLLSIAAEGMPDPFPAGYIAQTEYFYTSKVTMELVAAARLQGVQKVDSLEKRIAELEAQVLRLGGQLVEAQDEVERLTKELRA